MSQHPRAGQPAQPGDLVDVPALLRAYDELRPDPSDPAQRVAFGTSGHRGSAFRAAFNEAHILATTEAICRYRSAQETTGPLFIGRDTHALSEPAWRTALEVLVANGVDVRVDAEDGYTPTPAVSHAILVANRDRSDGLADGIVVTPSHNPPDDGGFKYNPPNGGPADTDVTRWIQDEANRILEASGVRRAGRDPARPVRARPASTAVRLRVPAGVRRRPRQRRGPRGGARVRAAARRGPARRRGRRVLGADRGAVRAGPDRDQRRGRPDVRVHDPRLGREDPDGPVVAVRDGAARRAARPVRPRAGQRRRRRPPRHRRAGRGTDEPEPRDRGLDLVPVRRRAVVGIGRRGREDARVVVDHRPGGRVARAAAPGGAGRVQVVRRRAGGRVGRLSAARRAPGRRSCAATARSGPPTRTGSSRACWRRSSRRAWVATRPRCTPG